MWYGGDGLDVHPDVLALALQCLASRAIQSHESRNFTSEIYKYDIPLGQSASVKSNSLLTLLESSGKSFCILPLLKASESGTDQLVHGDYVGALLTTGTAGAMTLVIVGTLSTSSWLVRRATLARARTSSGLARNRVDSATVTNAGRVKKRPRSKRSPDRT